MFIPIGDEESRPGSTAIMVIVIIAINVAVFVAETQIMAQGGDAASGMIEEYGAVPYLLSHDLAHHWTTVFSSMFMHASWMHLLGNMLFMWIFADNVEDLLGEVPFVLFYLTCGVAALAAHVLVDPDSQIPLVGASGAISGVLGAYIAMFPNNSVRNFYWLWLFVGIARLPAWLYLGFWFLMQVGLASGSGHQAAGGVAFAAHAGGFMAGVLLIFFFPKRQETLDYYRWRTMT